VLLTQRQYDAIVVGARCAGSLAAMHSEHRRRAILPRRSGGLLLAGRRVARPSGRDQTPARV